MQRVFRRLGATAGVLFACLGCGGIAPEEPPNILLLSIDTLRADHLGCYGYARSTSPRIDAFARSATRFSRAFAPTPWTLTSHVEMLTGRHPYLIGVRDKFASIPAAVPMLAELLSEAGYETAAFVDSRRRGYVGGERGFARGFDVYRHAPHRKGIAFEYDVKRTVERGLDWIRSREEPSRPFMLFLHTKSVHTVKDQTPRADPRTPPYDVPTTDRFRFVSEATRNSAGTRRPWAAAAAT